MVSVIFTDEQQELETPHVSVQKTEKSGPEVCPKALAAEGGRDVRLAGGLSQIHTVIQMAKMLKPFHKQAHYLNLISDGSIYKN